MNLFLGNRYTQTIARPFSYAYIRSLAISSMVYLLSVIYSLISFTKMNFKYVVGDQCMSEPDLGVANTSSLLECAVRCALMETCVLWSLWQQERTKTCQFSQTQRMCLHERVFYEGACRMYQRKVCILLCPVSIL